MDSQLIYHGRDKSRVIPKSMSTVIVLDDDLRAFNCFREQMVAMIHGVFNNSRVVCQGDSLPFTLANLAGPINFTRKLNLSHMIKYFHAENTNLVAESQTMLRNLEMFLRDGGFLTTREGE